MSEMSRSATTLPRSLPEAGHRAAAFARAAHVMGLTYRDRLETNSDIPNSKYGTVASDNVAADESKFEKQAQSHSTLRSQLSRRRIQAATNCGWHGLCGVHSRESAGNGFENRAR